MKHSHRDKNIQMNLVLHIITASTFILFPRLISVLRWYLGLIEFCNSGTNYILLVGILSSNLLHIINIGNIFNNEITWKKYFFLSSIFPAIIIDVITCWIYLMECLNPNYGFAFPCVIIASIVLNTLPNILVRFS